MKIKIAFAIIIAFLIAIPTDLTIAAGPPDQYCVAGKGYTTMIREEASHVAQSFKPKETHLSKVTMKIKGDGNGKLGIGIADGNLILAWNNESAMAEPNGSEQTITFTFNDLVLTPDKEYKIWPRISTDNTVLFWYYKDSCYDRGSAYMGSNAKIYDFDFATYGWSEDAPATPKVNPTATPTTKTSSDQSTPTPTSTTSSTSTSSTPDQENSGIVVDDFTLSSNISKDIAPPDDLVVLDTPNDQGGSLDLTWKKSKTEGIENYTVFRQKDLKDDIYKIGETQTTAFTDNKATTGEIFYYFVRANKDALQSENSKIVKGMSVSNLLANQKEEQQTSFAWYMAAIVFLLALIGTGIFLYIKFRKNNKKKDQIIPPKEEK